MLDALKVAHFYTGKIDEAVRYGQRALELRDAEAAAIRPTSPSPSQAARRRGTTSSLSRCGDRRRFIRTAP